MKSYVIGIGKSGIAAARLLKRQGWQVTVSDRNASESLLPIKRDLQAEGIEVLLGHTLAPDPAHMQRIVVSPGVPWDLPVLERAQSLGIETLGELELAWRSLQSYPWIGITGTNGKTTVTSLIAAMFKAAGLNAPACGNIGYAACDLALTVLYPDPTAAASTPLDWVVAEISSYQIEASPSIAPQIGVWTTFTPDHLSRHKTLERYFAIKASLLDHSRHQIFNGDDPYLRRLGAEHWATAWWTSIAGKEHLVGNPERGAWIESDWVMVAHEPVVAVNTLRMVGLHNRQNLLMAVTAAHLAGIEKGAIARAIETFPGVPHRLEQVCQWQGIDLINDSKATNYDAAEVGLKSVAPPVILIAGGDAKEGDDTQWLNTIRAKAAAVLLIGDAAPAFAQRLQSVGYSSYEIVETLENAVPRAANLAKQHHVTAVLLSPACASFDQYDNFEQRGDHFRQLCLDRFA
ncbi:MAG: UDP-N-acetylmuramoyl-L-alanine--D-glutamate ligase [Elainellaceae cyanobacterium]